MKEVEEVNQELINNILETGEPVMCKTPIKLTGTINGLNQVIIQGTNEGFAIIRRDR